MKKEGDLPVACIKWYDFTKWLLERVWPDPGKLDILKLEFCVTQR